MGDDHVVDVVLGDLFDAIVDGAVQSEAFTPDDLGTMVLGPLGDLVVVAGDERREFADGAEHAGRHPARETGPVIVTQRADQPSLGGPEPLHRDEYGDVHWRRL